MIYDTTENKDHNPPLGGRPCQGTASYMAVFGECRMGSSVMRTSQQQPRRAHKGKSEGITAMVL